MTYSIFRGVPGRLHAPLALKFAVESLVDLLHKGFSIMKRSWTCFLIGLIFFAGMATQTNFAKADEGMWLFNNPPRKILKDKYQFDATDKWLEHVQKSSVRFNSGGSGSFVS